MVLEPNIATGERSFRPRRERSQVFEVFEALRRRLWPMLAVFFLGIALACAAAWFWPATYRSTGVILIEQGEVPEDFVRTAVTSYADQRVQVIGQRVMTSTNLLAIARKFNLYSEQANATRQALLDRMRRDIRLEMISADVVDPRVGRPTKATIAFSIGFDSSSPQLAAEVANELTSLYLSENLESRQQLAAGTAAFLNVEAEKFGARVKELEAKIGQFKETHREALPELSEFNIQVIGRNEEELRALEARHRLLDQQIVSLDAQLAQVTPSAIYVSEGGERILSPADRLKIARSEFASASALYLPDHPTLQKLRREISALEREVGGPAAVNDISRELTEARGELASARERYSAEHPDTVALQRRIASLEKQLESASSKPAVTAETRADLADNPAYIQLQAQRRAAQNERDSLLAEKTELRARISEFEKRLLQAPLVERDYNALLREFESERGKYEDIRRKQTEAQLASNLETERKGEKFTLNEPPVVPETPVSPNRLAMLLLGLGLSLAAAITLGLILETLDTRIRGRRGIVMLLDTPPLAVIPWVSASK